MFLLQKVINAIVKYCGTKFFASRLPGHTVLLLNFIHGASTVVNSSAIKGVSELAHVPSFSCQLRFVNLVKVAIPNDCGHIYYLLDTPEQLPLHHLACRGQWLIVAKLQHRILSPSLLFLSLFFLFSLVLTNSTHLCHL